MTHTDKKSISYSQHNLTILAIAGNETILPDFTIVRSKIEEILPGNWFIQLRSKLKYLFKNVVNQIVPETFCSFTFRENSYIVFRREKNCYQSAILMKQISEMKDDGWEFNLHLTQK